MAVEHVDSLEADPRGASEDNEDLQRENEQLRARIAELEARRTAEDERADVVAYLQTEGLYAEWAERGEHVGAAARAKEPR